jgi:LacI family transcriptional regulator
MPVRRVALLIESSRQFGREMLRGVIRYQLERGPWEIAFEPRGFTEVLPDWLGRWRGHGMIARIRDRRTARALRRKGLPLIDLRGLYPHPNVPAVTIDNREVVRLAIEHFAEIGLRRLAYVGVPPGGDPWLDDRRREFRRQADAVGFPCHVYSSRYGIVDDQLVDERRPIARWLKTLPRPIGVFAYNDNRGHQVLDACRTAGIRVPDEAAVIGVDNDEFLCDLSCPSLTSVTMNLQEVGYEAARLLDRMMSGRRPDTKGIGLRAKSLVVRQSTSSLTVDDEAVRSAIQYIREHACNAISVTRVAAESGVSRRTLEQRFAKVVGRTIASEILRVRMNIARKLLSATRLPVEEVARKVGVATAAHFAHRFKRATGRTPRDYRNQYLV